jgi:glycopeptide antibiotics resistance protein
VFAGLISAWFLWHYEKSQFFHWSLTLFWGLLALVHWIDVRGTSADVGGNLVTTIPFLLFASLGLARAATEQSSPRRT